ncbi:MAG: ABC transporter permease [Verrucomicrobia bacterium]|nr:ABC transporter permease [Verrucomicrobiota bacterium]
MRKTPFKVVLRRLCSLMIKEWLQIVRDPSSLLICVVLPLVLLVLYGYGVSLDMNNIKVGIVLEDTAPDATSFARAFLDSPYFEPRVVRDRRELEREMLRGDIRGIIVVPSYFSQFRRNPSQIAPIQVIADGSEPNTASFVQNYAMGAWRNWLAQEQESSRLRTSPPVQAQTRFWYNEGLASRYFLVPGSLAIIMTLIGTLLTSLVVAREWERGTMESLMATPVTVMELIVGKLIPYFILGMGSMVMTTFVAVLIYKIPFRGSLWLLTLVSAVFLFCALNLGLLISTTARNQFVAAQTAIVSSFLPATILSGFLFEIGSMPLPIQWLTYCIPARYFVTSLQTLFLVGNVPSLIFKNIIMMLALGGVLLVFIIRRTRKRLD